MFSIFSGVTNLASQIIHVWAVLETRKQKAVDRDHQIRLQQAQHGHERLMQDLRSRKPESGPDHDREIIGGDTGLLERLRIEAYFLSEMGFEVIYEPGNDGYGLALPLERDSVLAFWILPSYPNRAPQVYLSSPSGIERIDFESGAWQTDHTIAEIVSAVVGSEAIPEGVKERSEDV